MKIKEHIPGFVDWDDPPIEVEFSSIEELMDIPFVSKWKFENFYRFSIAKDDIQPTLMAESDLGYSWWVVGYLKDGLPDLPDWAPKYRSK